MKAKDGEINIVLEATSLFINITLCCLFGIKKNNIKVLQRRNGVEQMCLLGDALSNLVEKTMARDN